MFNFYNNRYERVYIPTILTFNKQDVPNYSFVKTIDAGSSLGHILFNEKHNQYFMCLRQNDNISVEEKTMEPLGFKRSNISDLETLAEKFNKSKERERRYVFRGERRKWKQVVEPMRENPHLNWNERVKGKFIINTITGQEISLEGTRSQISKQTGLNNELVSCLVREGIEAKHWAYKGKRLDGATWEEYLEDPQKYNPKNNNYFNIVFKRGSEAFYFESLRTTSARMNVSHELLRQAIISNLPSINGYDIIKL